MHTRILALQLNLTCRETL